MKLTPDRLAVARMVNGTLSEERLREIIESLPEPPDDSPATLPVPDAQALRGQIESEVWEARKRIEAALHAEIAELRAQIVDVVFDGPPGPEGGRFVECEDADGVSINAGNWWQREDGYWALRIVRPPTRTVQAQNRDHDAEMFRRGWVAGQADALKQIDAARAEEREALRRVLCERCQKNL